MANQLRGETELPGAPEGVVFSLSNDNIAFLQKQFGQKWFSQLPEMLDDAFMPWIDQMVQLGCKKDGKAAGLKVKDFDNVPIHELSKALLDGAYVAVTGRTFAEQLAWLQEQGEEALKKAAADRPPMALKDGSEISET